jgi:uncharacterized protein YbjT (DUF2867 family)
LVVGAHHGTGALVVEAARAAGVHVDAFVGDVLDHDAVLRALSGHDAVISLLGPRADSPVDVCSRGTANIVGAMTATGVSRLVVVTGAMIGHDPVHLGLLYRTIQHFLPHELLDDRRASEAIVRDSDLQWTIVRPPRLTDGDAGPVQVDTDLDVGAFAHLSRASLWRRSWCTRCVRVGGCIRVWLCRPPDRRRAERRGLLRCVALRCVR